MLNYKTTILAVSGVVAIALSLLHVIGTMPKDSKAGIPGYSSLATVTIQSVPNERFVRSDKETTLGFVSRVSRTVQSTTFNCAPGDFHLSWAERLMWASIGSPNIFADGILVRSRFDCGYCHQRAFLVKDLLHDAGIEAEVWGLNGHVVLRLDHAGQAYFVDPDLGPGPFAVNLDGGPMIDVARVYANSSAANVDALRLIYADASDDAPYGGLEYAAHYQKQVFFYADALVGVLGAAGLLALCASAFFVRSRYSIASTPRRQGLA
ncbi:hypothetical protein [Pseudaminobacter sp. NGMCC 1.201702]|uniref:hypothetical protein n=1 Tax=Pseudaminobacter sp. NGMCC 1.201702 TaxID=3391825 RepID=UPI0039EF8200